MDEKLPYEPEFPLYGWVVRAKDYSIDGWFRRHDHCGIRFNLSDNPTKNTDGVSYVFIAEEVTFKAWAVFRMKDPNGAATQANLIEIFQEKFRGDRRADEVFSIDFPLRVTVEDARDKAWSISQLFD